MLGAATTRMSLAALLAGSALASHSPASAQTACSTNQPPLIIYHAGSLSAEFTAVEQLFTQQTGACVTDVAAGSLDAARRITAGGQPADIFAAADYLDIEYLLKPAHYANYDIVFATSRLVLAYTTASRNAGTIAATGMPFSPPNSVPQAAADWAGQVVQDGVLIGGTNPFLDPTGYRIDLVFQLAAQLYPATPGLYNTLLNHYAVLRPADVLGTTYDYQIIYESSALAAYRANPSTYRYVALPDEVSLGAPSQEQRYNQDVTVVPGLGLQQPVSHVAIPGTQAAWGVTILETSEHKAAAAAFLQLLFSAQGEASQAALGPTPINPPVVSATDYRRLPASLKNLVSIQ